MRRLRIMIQKLFLLSLCSFLAISLSAQKYTTKKTVSGKAKKSFEKAKQYAFERQYDRAMHELDRILEKDPTFIDALIDRAEIHFDQKRYAVAEKDFETAMAIDPAYNPRVFYILALAELKQKKPLEAAKHFEQYAESETRNEERKAKALRYRDNALFADHALKNPVPFQPKSLGANINTQYSEYLPSFTADSETLIYTARTPFRGRDNRLQEQEDFFIAKKVNGGWTKGQPLEGVNTPLSEGAQSVSADGRFLVFTGCNRKEGYGSCDIYFSEYKNDRWTSPKNIGGTINSKAWESLPSLSADGRTMYFTSERASSIGGKDIYVTYRDDNGNWSKPKNVGAPINTTEDDQSPFIHPDGKTLYFMSMGHPGMGNYDLYFSRLDENNQWATPTNLGYPINTKANEGALTVSLDGKTAYFASDLTSLKEGETTAFTSGTSRSDTDIYSFDLYPEARPLPVTYVKAKVKDVETKKDLIAQVEFIDLENGTTHTSSETNEYGEFLVVLPMGKDYALNVSKKRYLFHSENFGLAESNSLTDPFLLEIDLVPIKEKSTVDATIIKAKPIILKNVFFATASAELLDASLIELQRLKQLLEDNNNLKIQINGHTDNVGSETANQTLSTDRAKAVYNYLIESGIAAKRLRYKGFGESMPIESNDTKAGRQSNRRTEFEVF